MKKSVIIWVFCLASLAFVSCEENYDLDTGNSLAVSKKSAIKKGEPTIFTFKSMSSNGKIEWAVTPNRNVQIQSSGNTARILFGEAGNYTVSATDHRTTARVAVTVDSTTYIPGDSTSISDSTFVPSDTMSTDTTHIPKDTTIIVIPIDTSTHIPVDTVGTHDIIVRLNSDEFTFTPSIIDSSSTLGLGFNVVSSKSYQCMNSYLQSSYFYQDYETKSFRMHLNYVIQPGSRYCDSGIKKLSVFTAIYPLSEGRTSFEVELNGVIYKGTIVKAGNNFTISWPHSSGVKFSKLTLTK